MACCVHFMIDELYMKVLDLEITIKELRIVILYFVIFNNCEYSKSYIVQRQSGMRYPEFIQVQL